MFKDIDQYLDWYYSRIKKPPYPQWTCYREDHKSLLTLIQDYSIKSFLEIGTWSGWTSLCLWLYGALERHHTIDIHKCLGVEYIEPNHELQCREFYGHFFKDTYITIEFCDTMTRLPKEGESYDMVYIDGNHDMNHIINDSNLAFKLSKKVIAWHDFGSESAITEYLKTLPGIEIIEGSIIAYKIL
jgi:predicted O-methyltransferase YrrM